MSTAGARCPSTAVVGLVVMGELAWAVGEGKDGEWLKGGPSHVCTDARELSGQFPHSGCCPGRFSWPPGKRRGSCSSVSATNCSLPDRKRRRAIPHRSFHTPLVVSSQLPLLPSPWDTCEGRPNHSSPDGAVTFATAALCSGGRHSLTAQQSKAVFLSMISHVVSLCEAPNMYVCVCSALLGGYVHVDVGVHRSQKEYARSPGAGVPGR